MLYYAYNKELGAEDAYDRVLDGEHRGLVKSAFNAMIQASTNLRNCPSNIDPSIADMSWSELRDRIIEAHRPIEHLFFCGKMIIHTVHLSGSRLPRRVRHAEGNFIWSIFLQCSNQRSLTCPRWPSHYYR